LILKNAKDAFLGFQDHFEKIGIGFDYFDENTVAVFKKNELKALDIKTDFYPGFPTDLQAQIMTLLCLADKPSIVQETIWENRFMHIPELNRMGANISIISKNEAKVNPIKRFQSANVMATDLRASACLIIAALNAPGRTVIDRIYHIERGYENIVQKLKSCGVQISKIY
jgi:UDP-N-acetylglucosamine 1-carboxyvinyltransferase